MVSEDPGPSGNLPSASTTSLVGDTFDLWATFRGASLLVSNVKKLQMLENVRLDGAASPAAIGS